MRFQVDRRSMIAYLFKDSKKAQEIWDDSFRSLLDTQIPLFIHGHGNSSANLYFSPFYLQGKSVFWQNTGEST